jgi:hypothetical protein
MSKHTAAELHDMAISLPGWPSVKLNETTRQPVRLKGMMYRRTCEDGSKPERQRTPGPLPREAYWYPKQDHEPRAQAYTGRYLLQVDDVKTALALADLLRPLTETHRQLKATGQLGLWRRFVHRFIHKPDEVGPISIQIAQAIGCWPGGLK